MGVTLSIRNVPERLARDLKRRAARHGRSLQSELLAVLEEVASRERPLTPAQVLARARKLGLSRRVRSVRVIRAARDAGTRR